MSISKNGWVKQLKPQERYLQEVRHQLFQTLLSLSFCKGTGKKKKKKRQRKKKEEEEEESPHQAAAAAASAGNSTASLKKPFLE